MGRKRRQTNKNIERLKKKIRKYEERLESYESSSSDSELESVESHGNRLVQDGSDKELDEIGILNSLAGENLDPNIQVELPMEIGITEEQKLDPTILELLGDNPADKNKKGVPIHTSIAERWTDILSGGLDKDIKVALLREYPAPLNCPVINAPQLNLEIKAAIPENTLKRDKILELKQKQLAAALSCLGQATNIMLKNQEKQALKFVSDAARILCDQQYFESVTRRHLILNILNKTTKDAIQGVKPGEWLFGKDLNERIKACKAVNKSAIDLKNRAYNRTIINTPLNQPSTSGTLNWRGPSQPAYRPRSVGLNRGGPRQTRQTRPNLQQYRTSGYKNFKRP